jgi:hypothetical protein
MSNSPSRSRDALASEACNFASLTPNRGVGRAPRDVRVLSGTPVGHAITRHARRLARRLASHDAGRSPLGAPPWRFWAPGAALPSPWAPAVLQRRAVAFGSVQRAPRSQVVVPGGRGPGPPGASGYEPPAAERHSPLRVDFSQGIENRQMFMAEDRLVHTSIYTRDRERWGAGGRAAGPL